MRLTGRHTDSRWLGRRGFRVGTTFLGDTESTRPATTSRYAGRATLPVKSLTTGMKLRDERMLKYIFLTRRGA